jgi:uncharacterized protein (TIGR00369 family)
MPRMTIAEIEALLDQHFPDWRTYSRITALGDKDITVTMPFHPRLMRAGGTISGPAMMALADSTAYYLLLAHAGPIPNAATANLDIHFLSRPKPVDLICTATMLRLGRRLAVSAVDIHSAGELVAHATVTYAVPPSDPHS